MKLKIPEMTSLKAACKRFFLRFKIPMLFLALGLLLLSFSANGKKTQSAAQEPVPTKETAVPQDETQERLENLLSHIEGVGRVKLLLSQARSAESVYQTDTRRTGGDSGYTEELTTVFFQSSGAQKEPVVTMTRDPVYRGAVVVCDGADSASVRLSVINAVSSLTGLGSDKITVVKMKGSTGG